MKINSVLVMTMLSFLGPAAQASATKIESSFRIRRDVVSLLENNGTVKWSYKVPFQFNDQPFISVSPISNDFTVVDPEISDVEAVGDEALIQYRIKNIHTTDFGVIRLDLKTGALLSHELNGEIEGSSKEASLGVFQIVAKHSGKCLDIYNSDRTGRALVDQWQCFKADNQLFKLVESPTKKGKYSLKAKHSALCLSTADLGNQNGAQIVQRLCNDQDEQHVSLKKAKSGAFQIIFDGNNKCLDVYGSNLANKAKVNQWSCVTGAANQEWFLVRSSL